MADILKISTPLIDKTPISQTRPVDPSQPFNISDITRVVKTNDASELLQQNTGLIDDNAPKLLTDLIKNPMVTVSIMRNIYMLQEIAGLLPANNTTLTEEIQALFDQLMLNPGDISRELGRQEENSTLFKGEMFDVLRNILAENRSNPEMSKDIGVLLKSLIAQVSNNDALDSVANNLVYIKGHFSESSPFSQAIDKLINAFRRPDAAQNLPALKNELFAVFNAIKSSPLLTSGMEKTMSLTIYNLSRFNDNEEFFPEALTKLLDSMPDGAQKDKLVKSIADYFNRVFPEGHLASGIEKKDLVSGSESSVMKTLSKIIGFEAKNSEARVVSGENVEKIIHSLLSSPCNFTPLLHFILPVMFEDMPAFAEMWIDPNAEDENSGKGKNSAPVTHAFVVFDINDIGKFELDLIEKNKRISAELLCPEEFLDYFKYIGVSIRKSLANSDYSFESINIGKLERDRSLMDVFKDLPRKRTGVNVRI